MIVSAPLAALFALAAAFSLFELARPRERAASYLADTEAHAAHVVMNGAMAAMFSPIYSAGIERALFWLLGAATAVLLVRLVLAMRASNRNAAASAIYHALVMAAMIYAMTLMPAPPSAGEAMHHGLHGGHAAHTGHVVAGRTWPGIVLGAVFLIDALATIVMVSAFTHRVLEHAGKASTVPLPRQVAIVRRSAIPHVLMDAGMALMLL